MKLKLFLLLLIVLFTSSVYAQQAKVIDVSGEVVVKQDPSMKEWSKLTKNMALSKSAELETKNNAFCTLAFDPGNKNIVTVKENSRIRIESVEPGYIFLPKGRVLSLVNKVAAGQKFQVRTPTAIAGARGTGWGTGTDGVNSSAECFENTIYVQGLDEQGNVTGEQDVSSGMGTSIGRGGVLGESSPLGDADYTEWNDFSGYTDDVTDGQGGTGGTGGADTGSTIGDSRDDQRDDQRENTGENLRKEEEKSNEKPQEETGTEEGSEEGSEEGYGSKF